MRTTRLEELRSESGTRQLLVLIVSRHDTDSEGESDDSKEEAAA